MALISWWLVAEGDVGAAGALVAQRLAQRGQTRGCGGVAVVPSGDRDVAGHGATRPGRSAERAESEFVAHRGDRIGRVVLAEQLAGEGFTLRGGIGRDAPTLLCYAALASDALWLYAFGPALALLRAELGFSYALLGLYSALWSAGAALVG